MSNGSSSSRGAGTLTLAVVLCVSSAWAQSDAPGLGAAATSGQPDSAELASDAERKEAARQAFMRGIAALREGAVDAALADFLLSRELFPTKNATLNAAICLRQRDRLDEELAMLEAFLRDFTNVTPEEKREAQRRVAALRAELGTIEIDGAELGAAIVIDGRNRADFPAVAPLRVRAGAHVVRVHKEGFEPFEIRIDVAGGQTVRVQAKLRGLRQSGRLRVLERGGRVLEVVVDGVAVGRTPWEGALALGKHVVALHGDGAFGAQPALAIVTAQQVTLLTLGAEELTSSLLVEATPAGAAISIDSVEVARGVWTGRLRSGPHRIEVAADGFLAERREVTLRPGSERLAIELERDMNAPMWRKPSRILVETSAALGLAPTLGGDVAGTCEGSCESSMGLGALANVHVAYELGTGLGLGLGMGYVFVERSFTGRALEVQPFGLAPVDAAADETLRLTGVSLSAEASLRTEAVLPLLFRIGVGGVFGRLGVARHARFPVSEDTVYEAPPIADSHAVNHLLITPEAALRLRLARHVELDTGIAALVLIALSTPTWGDEAPRPVLIPRSGYGTYARESFTSTVSLLLAPRMALRYQF